MSIEKTQSFHVTLFTRAEMRGSLDVRASSAERARALALERAGDVEWKYDGTCEGPDGPAVTGCCLNIVEPVAPADPLEPQPFVTTKEAAARLRCAVPTVVRYIKLGWLYGRRIGRSWRIDPKSIDRILENTPLEPRA